MTRNISTPRVAVLALVLIAIALGAFPEAARAAGPDYRLDAVASGYKRSTYITANSNPLRLFVVEQRGIIMVLKRASTDLPWQKAGVFLDMRERVMGPFVGRGLLGLAFDPDYAHSGRFYVFYNRKPDGFVTVAEYRRRSSLRAKPGSWREVLVVPYTTAYHFGGWIGFGPDGSMYMTTGDGTQSGAGPQDLDSRRGKVLRFDPHKADGQAGFALPSNPYVGLAGDDLIWASGLRNPWRASFDRATGALWLPDVGDSLYEEVNRFSPSTSGAGANLGWPLCEGAHAYPEDAGGSQTCAAPGVSLPLIEYPHADGNCSVIGGYVYRGSAQLPLVGRYFFGDYCSGNIWSIPADYTRGDLGAPLASRMHINSFGVDALGEIYVVGGNGTVWHLAAD